MRRCTGFSICLFWGLTISNVEAAPAAADGRCL